MQRLTTRRQQFKSNFSRLLLFTIWDGKNLWDIQGCAARYVSKRSYQVTILYGSCVNLLSVLQSASQYCIRHPGVGKSPSSILIFLKFPSPLQVFKKFQNKVDIITGLLRENSNLDLGGRIQNNGANKVWFRVDLSVIPKRSSTDCNNFYHNQMGSYCSLCFFCRSLSIYNIVFFKRAVFVCPPIARKERVTEPRQSQ